MFLLYFHICWSTLLNVMTEFLMDEFNNKFELRVILPLFFDFLKCTPFSLKMQ